MEYKNENAGIELLLAHMNIEDFIQEAEHFYCVDEEVESGVSFDEIFLQEDMDENEETPHDLITHAQNPGKVRYGTASDLLDFVNMVSNIPSSSLLEVGQEMGVLLNKVSSIDGYLPYIHNIYTDDLFSALSKWMYLKHIYT